jgi:hypothetical protein
MLSWELLICSKAVFILVTHRHVCILCATYYSMPLMYTVIKQLQLARMIVSWLTF